MTTAHAEQRSNVVRVYLDPSAVFVRIGDGEEPVLAPDAPAALHDLADTGLEAVLINPDVAQLPPALERLAGADDVDPTVTGWIITGDRHRCEQRYPQLRIVLVGGGPAADNGRQRCDAESPDLRGAVLHIMSREAMP